MNEISETRPTSAGRDFTDLRTWVSPRRKRFWVVVLLLAYTLFGFFGAPPLVRHFVVAAVSEQTGRAATLGEVRINPFLATLEARDFALEDRDGTPLLTLQRLFVDFQFSSLFRWAWTFREIRLQGLDGLLERYAPGDSRLTRLLADLAARAEPSTVASEDAGLPRLLVHELGVEDSSVTFRDAVPADPVELRLGPVTASVQELNTLPEREGRQAVSVSLPDGSSVRWQGSLRLGPLQSQGQVEITESGLDLTIAYLKATLPLTALQATLSARTAYSLAETADGGIEFSLSNLEAELTRVAVSGLEPDGEFIALDRLAVSGGSLEYPAQSLRLESVSLDRPRLSVHRDASGGLNLEQLVPAASGTEADQGATAQAPPWSVEIGRIEVAEGEVALADASVEPPAELSLVELGVTLQNVSNSNGQRMPLQVTATLPPDGQLAFDGTVVALPQAEGAGSLQIETLSLPVFQPYIAGYAAVALERGSLSGTFDLALPPGAAPAVNGQLSVGDLAVQDTGREQPLLGWERMDLDRFEADLASGALTLFRIDLLRPYGRLTIFDDKTTNLAGLVAETPGKAEPEEGAATPLNFILGGVAVTDGALDFADLSLPLPFATEIRQLGGTVSTLDSRSEEPANIRFEGQVDEFGLARIDGALKPLDLLHKTNIRMEFRNLLMSDLSPYTAEFAGREIAAGKMDLDLVYRIEGGMLQGQNDIVMSDLVLGDAVDSPGAASLPLGLAVALLKDSNGVIDIELPVEGDVNDPEFRIGGVVWQAIVGLVTKIASAPFRLLGGLVGADSEDIGAFQFLPGRADLTPPEREKIGLLRQALDKRPELKVEIGGAYVAAVDRPAMQFFRLRERVLTMLEERSRLEHEDFQMLDDELRGALETLYVERFPDSPLEQLRERHRASDDQRAAGAPEFDQLAYAGELRDRLLESEEITPANLLALAEQRAEAVGSALTEAGVPTERMARSAPAESESEDGEWVLMELGVSVE